MHFLAVHIYRTAMNIPVLMYRSIVAHRCTRQLSRVTMLGIGTFSGMSTMKMFGGTQMYSLAVQANRPVAGASLPATRKFALRLYSSNRQETVEKKLIQLMDMWEVEDAVALLRKSVLDEVVPQPNVILNLQQQLANLGEVECLLELHDFLKEHILTTDTRFFQCLQEAYYNSGRISEGVVVLRLLYHRTRKFPDVDVYFTLLTVMVLRHFPNHISLILSFVTDLKDAEVPVLEPEASLWKCYMLTESWSEADDLLLGNEKLRALIPYQVTRIIQGVDKADFNQVTVFTCLLNVPFIRQKLRVLVAEALIAEHVSKKEWPKLLKSLKHIQMLNLPLHTDKLASVLNDLQRHLSPQYDAQIQELRQWCDSLQKDGTK